MSVRSCLTYSTKTAQQRQLLCFVPLLFTCAVLENANKLRMKVASVLPSLSVCQLARIQRLYRLFVVSMASEKSSMTQVRLFKNEFHHLCHGNEKRHILKSQFLKRIAPSHTHNQDICTSATLFLPLRGDLVGTAMG